MTTQSAKERVDYDALRAAYERELAAKDGEIARLKQPTDVSYKVVTCQIYGHHLPDLWASDRSALLRKLQCDSGG